MASLGAAAGTWTTCGCNVLTSGRRFLAQAHMLSAPRRSLLQCRAEAQRSAQGRISKNTVDANAASLNSTADDTTLEDLQSLHSRFEEEKPERADDNSKPELPLEQLLMQRLRLDKAVEEMVGFMAPREKGDIRDVILMSLSFAVFVYISQRLVCAYCVLRHMMHHSF